MADPKQLSQQAHDRLQAELEDLTTRGRIDIARKIETARELGDLSENGDYHAAKEEQGKMEGRIRQIESILTDAIIVEDSESDGVVGTGSVIGIRYAGDDDVERYLLGSIEERHDDLDVMSPGSPLGSKLMGQKVGDTVEFDSPTGATIEVEIVVIES
jgi:transcription elongation factor GreA